MDRDLIAEKPPVMYMTPLYNKEFSGTEVEKLCCRKCKLIDSDKKKFSGCWEIREGVGGGRGKEGWEEEITKDHYKTLKGDGHIDYDDFSNHFLGVNICQN